MSPKILVIDDSPMLRRIAVGVISRELHASSVATADNAALGVNLSDSDRPDLILLDQSLPDMDTEAFCERLRANPATADIPVVLMHSNGTNIPELQTRFPNIRRGLAKPFPPETLVETVRDLLSPGLRSILGNRSGASSASPITPQHSPAVPSPTTHSGPRDQVSLIQGNVVLMGNTRLVPVRRLLKSLEDERQTGVLRFFCTRQPIELYLSDGRVALATTRDLALYCQGSNAIIPDIEPSLLEEVRNNQRNLGCPIFLTLHRHSRMRGPESVARTREHSIRLFSRLWESANSTFEFEELDALPDFLKAFPAILESADQWLLKSTRPAGAKTLQSIGITASTVPVVAMDSADRLDAFGLENREMEIFESIDNATSIEAIAHDLDMEIEDACLTVARLVRVELVELYFPKG